MIGFLQKYFSISEDEIWEDENGGKVIILETKWFQGIFFKPVVVFYYINLCLTDIPKQLKQLDRYTFTKYMKKTD